jgi:ABC-type branched-subunit amino acid transport system substrate-binding protein
MTAQYFLRTNRDKEVANGHRTRACIFKCAAPQEEEGRVEVKKKLLFVFLALILVLGLLPLLAACGGTTTTTTVRLATTATSGATTTMAPGTTTASSSTETTAAGQTKTLTIGGIAFLTGPAAAGGIACKTGWELAVDKYNDAGGLKIGNDTYKINLIVEDDAMSVDQASTAATKLTQQDGATFVVGPLVDAFKPAIYPIVNQAGALYADVDTCNGSAKLNYSPNTDVSPDKPLYIRAHWANDEMMPYLLDYLQANYPSVKKVAACAVTEGVSPALFDALGTQLASRGLERVGDLQQIAPDASDYNPPVTNLLSANPDAICVLLSTPTTWGFVTKAARQLGFKGPVFCLTHLDVDFANTIAGGGNTDMFGAGVCLADLSALSQEMQDAHASYASHGYAAQDEIADVYLVGYNGMWVLLQAIEKAQSVDPQAVYDAYSKLTTPGDLNTLWGVAGDPTSGYAYVGGIQSTGVNVVLNEPYWIDAIGADGVPKNVQHIPLVKVP